MAKTPRNDPQHTLNKILRIIARDVGFIASSLRPDRDNPTPRWKQLTAEAAGKLIKYYQALSDELEKRNKDKATKTKELAKLSTEELLKQFQAIDRKEKV